MTVTIKSIQALEILDSRGNPTLEIRVTLADGSVGIACVPSGASTGTHEALELRDKDPKRFFGRGVRNAARHVEVDIAKALAKKNPFDQQAVDKTLIELDGTPNKSRLGANAILGVSLAVAHASAISKNMPLHEYLRFTYKFPKPMRMPVPMFNILNGGKHADSGFSVQEFLLIPKKKTIQENVRLGSEVFHSLKDLLTRRNLSTLVGDEGGFAPKLSSHNQAFSIILEAIKNASYKPGTDAVLGIDAASSEFYQPQGNAYVLKPEGSKLTPDSLQGLYKEWMRNYHLASIEDPFAEDDWNSWRQITSSLGSSVMLVGDDLFVTNTERLRRGIDQRAANAILIKVNQIGSLSETIECIKLAQKNNYRVVVSHRSGETTDTTIADLAVAVGADYIKAGSLSRGERLVKYNRLLEIDAWELV